MVYPQALVSFGSVFKILRLLSTIIVLLFVSSSYAIESSPLTKLIEPLKIALDTQENPVVEVFIGEDLAVKIPQEIWDHILSANFMSEALELRKTNRHFVTMFQKWGLPNYLKICGYHRQFYIFLGNVQGLLYEDAGIYPETEQGFIGDISSLLRARSNLLEKNKAIFPSFFFKDLETQKASIDALLAPQIPQLIEHFYQENPNLCQPGWVSKDITYLGNYFNIPPHTTIQSLKRFFNMIVRNRPLIVFATCVALPAFLLGVLHFYNQPRVADLQQVYQDFYTQTMVDGFHTPDEIEPMLYDSCYQDCAGGHTMKFWPSLYLPKFWPDDPNFRGPIFTLDRLLQRGYLSDLIHAVSSQCGCNFTYWLNFSQSVINGMKLEPGISYCAPNFGTNTICCGIGWWDSIGVDWEGVRGQSLSLNMYRGDAVCAQEVAKEMIPHIWMKNLILWSVLAAPLPFIFLFLMLFSVYCL